MAVLTGSACSSYVKMSVSNKVLLPDESSGYIISDASGEKKSALNSGGHKSLLITSEKYLARGRGFSPESLILDMGINEAVNGNYIEAEILFKEIQNNITDGSVENNLAVIYELTKRNNDSMKMYYQAINKSPENSKFRCNLLSVHPRRQSEF
jgi:Flp pilus assembly protein TadD